MQPEIEYLGYLPTQRGIKPQPKEVEAMLWIQRTKNYKQLKMFLGIVNYYLDMWKKRSHILTSLKDLAGSKKKKDWKWTEIEQAAYDNAKAMLIKEMILNYLVFKAL